MEVWELVPCSLCSDEQEVRMDEAEVVDKWACEEDNELVVDNGPTRVPYKDPVGASVHHKVDDGPKC